MNGAKSEWRGVSGILPSGHAFLDLRGYGLWMALDGLRESAIIPIRRH